MIIWVTPIFFFGQATALKVVFGAMTLAGILLVIASRSTSYSKEKRSSGKVIGVTLVIAGLVAVLFLNGAFKF